MTSEVPPKYDYAAENEEVVEAQQPQVSRFTAMWGTIGQFIHVERTIVAWN
jgi:hypothetical protein